jgi:large subunit ribosomal protein L23
MHIDARQILLRPLITEKGTSQQEHSNQYAFLVHRDANRIQVGKAVEELFPEVKVMKVRTMVRKGKPRRTFGRFHNTPTIKRALVTLRDGDSIDFF